MVCFPYAIMLPGRKSAFLAGFWPDCYRESTESTEVYSMDYNTLGQHFVHAVFFLIRANTREESLQYALRDLGNVCGIAQSTHRQFEVVRRLGLRGEDLVVMHIGSDEKAWQCIKQ